METSKTSSILTIVYAVHDFQAENPDELSFSAGEAIEVTEKDDLYSDGWWQGRNTKGQVGLFPQAYTVPVQSILPAQDSSPNQSTSKSAPQVTMNETLFEVQNAIDQLYNPSTSTTSLLPPSPNQAASINGSSGPVTGSSDQLDGEDDRESTLDLHSNPAQARALLAKKAQADSRHHSIIMERLKSASSQLYSTQRNSLASLVSVPGIGEIELSEESGGEDDPPKIPKSGSGGGRKPSKDSSSPSASPTDFKSSKHAEQGSADSARQVSFKPGPFSAAAMALGLTNSRKEQSSSNASDSLTGKGHVAQKLSSSSVLSDFGLDLREHFNLASAPVASALRMSRESSQFSSPSVIPNFLESAKSSDGVRTIAVNGQSAAPPLDEPKITSPQEQLSQEALMVVATSSTPRSQEIVKTKNSATHLPQTSSSTTSGVLQQQQQAPHLARPFQSSTQDNKNSVSTADSSSAKDSPSRSSSRVEQFVSTEDQPTSPATSAFPSSAGARQGGGDSLSSSQSRSHQQTGFGSFSSKSPEEWTVIEVVEWAKVKGLDEFTIGKLTEHEITGDVLLELDVNALKEIDLTAFGRRVRVMKAIEELKKNINHQKQMASTIESTFQSPNPSDPRKELVNNRASRPDSASKPDHPTLQYQQAYHPTAEVGDREEELANHSPRDSDRRSSHLPSHTKRPSDASGLSNKRLHGKDNSISSREESENMSYRPGYSRVSTSGDLAAQTPFSNFDNAQIDHRSDSVKSPTFNTRKSRSSSWARVSESKDNRHSDIVNTNSDHTEPIIPHSPETTVNEKMKKAKNKKSVASKPLKMKKSDPDSPEQISSASATPEKSTEGHQAKSRTSFLGNLRVRKPPPKLSSQSPVSSGITNGSIDSDTRLGHSAGSSASVNGKPGRSLFNFGQEKVQGQAQHQIQHLTPVAEDHNLISSPMEKTGTDQPEIRKEGETRTAMERIGTPDHMGWMRKKGDKYPNWKLRYFILKGSNLYYLKSQSEIRIKGLIKLPGFKVVMDADSHPGRYGFRIIHDNGSAHLFSADDSKLLRDWMKAIMKATIDRDWIAPVISSCNIRTIPIRDAQKMFPPPRPPSPLSRARLQKARLLANPDVLTEKDAAVLMSMQYLQNPGNRLSTGGALRPTRSIRRPSPDPSTGAMLTPPDSASFKMTSADQQILNWINSEISTRCPVEAKDFSSSIRNGIVVVRLIESLTNSSSGLKDSDFLKVDHVFGGHQSAGLQRQSIIEKDEDFDIYFTIFDFLNSHNIPLDGYSLNDLISGDPIKTRDFLVRVYNRFNS